MNKKWALVIASGPSQTRADCDALRGLCFTGAVNCAVFFAPWVDELYGADPQFWNYYGSKLQWFKGRRLSRSKAGSNIEVWHGKGWPRTGGNSGHQMLQRMVDIGFKNVALLGFDHQHTGGRTHSHGDHPRNKDIKLGNAQNTHHWHKAMNRTALDLERKGVKVLNLSRETALTCFERMSAEDFVNDYGNHKG